MVDHITNILPSTIYIYTDCIYAESGFEDLKTYTDDFLISNHDLYDDEYDRFWEICRAYDLYIDIVSIRKNGNDEKIPLEELMSLYEGSMFSDNKNIIEDLLIKLKV